MPSHLYEELDPNKKEFRLINILPPVRSSDVIEVRLSKHSLEKAPRYLGLSYACGNQNSRANIKVNGVSLSVTTNLHEALSGLRANNVGLLWVDAICIHQFDNDEKSAQVKLMGRIYELATTVIAWLGPWSVECADAMNLIRTWTIYPEEDVLSNFDSFMQMFPNAFDKTAWAALKVFFDQPYWSRMWTYQEFAAARALNFLCGDEEVTVTKLADAIFLWKKVKESATSLGLSAEMINSFDFPQIGNFMEIDNHRALHHSDEAFRRQWLTPRFGLSGILDSEHHRFTSDPRDKIFAVVAVDEIGDVKIVPDYNKTTVEVYTEYAIQYMKAQKLAVLAQSGVGILCVEGEDKPDLPSWVPDHRAHARWPMGMREKGFKASANLKPLFVVMRPKTLYANGVTVDIVSLVLPKSSRFNDNWNDFIRDYNVPNPTGVPQIQAFVRAVTIDSSESEAHPKLIKPEQRKKWFFDYVLGFMYGVGLSTLSDLLEKPNGRSIDQRLQELMAGNTDYVRWLTTWLCGSTKRQAPYPGTSDQELLEPFTGTQHTPAYLPFPNYLYGKDNPVIAYANTFRDYTNAVTMCRSFFTTKTGYIGVGPEGMQEGDVLTVICGSDVPILLRKVNDHYVNVGQCYVHGLMYGEITRAGSVKIERFCIK